MYGDLLNFGKEILQLCHNENESKNNGEYLEYRKIASIFRTEDDDLSGSSYNYQKWNSSSGPFFIGESIFIRTFKK